MADFLALGRRCQKRHGSLYLKSGTYAGSSAFAAVAGSALFGPQSVGKPPLIGNQHSMFRFRPRRTHTSDSKLTLGDLLTSHNGAQSRGDIGRLLGNR